MRACECVCTGMHLKVHQRGCESLLTGAKFNMAAWEAGLTIHEFYSQTCGAALPACTLLAYMVQSNGL